MFKVGDIVRRRPECLNSVFPNIKAEYVVEEVWGYKTSCRIVLKTKAGRRIGDWMAYRFELALPDKPIRRRDINRDGGMLLSEIVKRYEELDALGLIIKD